jgi:hypothetical protein
MTELQANTADILWLDNRTPRNFHAKRSRRQLGTIAQRAQHYSKWRREEKIRDELEVSERSALRTSDTTGKLQQGVLVSPPCLQRNDRFGSPSMDRSCFNCYHIRSASPLDLRLSSRGHFLETGLPVLTLHRFFVNNRTSTSELTVTSFVLSLRGTRLRSLRVASSHSKWICPKIKTRAPHLTPKHTLLSPAPVSPRILEEMPTLSMQPQFH